MGTKSFIYPAFILLFLGACSGKNNAFRNQYRWLSGKWIGKDGDKIIRENWKWEKYRFEGIGLEIVNGDTVFKEKLFIENFDSKPAYIVVLDDHNPMLFHQIKDTSGKLIFVNDYNDFPDRIEYQQDSDTSMTITLLAKDHANNGQISYKMRRLK